MKTIIKHCQHTLRIDSHGVEFKVKQTGTQYAVWSLPWTIMTALSSCLKECVAKQYHGFKLFQFPESKDLYRISMDDLWIRVLVLDETMDETLFNLTATYDQMRELLQFIDIGKGIYVGPDS